MPIQADLAFSSKNISPIGQTRIALLEAVGREGSISAAARAVNLSYKAAWDALDTMQNLVEKPLLEKTSGGKGGGGTKLTPAGIALIETFYRLQSGLAKMLEDSAKDLDAIGLTSSSFIQGFMMRTSARNIFAGILETVNLRSVFANIGVRVSPDIFITAQITRKSVETLGLVTGRHVAALVKAPFVMINPAKDDVAHLNSMQGVIREMLTEGDAVEITINLGADKTIVATKSTAEVRALNLHDDMNVTVGFDPCHVIIATH